MDNKPKMERALKWTTEIEHQKMRERKKQAPKNAGWKMWDQKMQDYTGKGRTWNTNNTDDIYIHNACPCLVGVRRCGLYYLHSRS